MGLTTWKDAPKGKIQKFDVGVAKNYLTESEMAQLQRLVSAYLDLAEDMALRQIPMTMQDWETRLNRFIAATDREILQDADKVTAEIAHAHAESEFEKIPHRAGPAVRVRLRPDHQEAATKRRRPMSLLANPPLNDSDWFRKDDDVRWQFGVPPKGNANFAWVRHFIHHLAPQGMAGFVLANGSSANRTAN